MPHKPAPYNNNFIEPLKDEVFRKYVRKQINDYLLYLRNYCDKNPFDEETEEFIAKKCKEMYLTPLDNMFSFNRMIAHTGMTGRAYYQLKDCSVKNMKDIIALTFDEFTNLPLSSGFKTKILAYMYEMNWTLSGENNTTMTAIVKTACRLNNILMPEKKIIESQPKGNRYMIVDTSKAGKGEAFNRSRVVTLAVVNSMTEARDWLRKNIKPTSKKINTIEIETWDMDNEILTDTCYPGLDYDKQICIFASK